MSGSGGVIIAFVIFGLACLAWVLIAVSVARGSSEDEYEELQIQRALGGYQINS